MCSTRGACLACKAAAVGTVERASQQARGGTVERASLARPTFSV